MESKSCRLSLEQSEELKDVYSTEEHLSTVCKQDNLDGLFGSLIVKDWIMGFD